MNKDKLHFMLGAKCLVKNFVSSYLYFFGFGSISHAASKIASSRSAFAQINVQGTLFNSKQLVQIWVVCVSFSYTIGIGQLSIICKHLPAYGTCCIVSNALFTSRDFSLDFFHWRQTVKCNSHRAHRLPIIVRPTAYHARVLSPA